MIITKTPFRISLCGGGSDLPSFYKKHGGCVLSTSINKYMYLSIHPYFQAGTTVLKYSQTEIVKQVEEIQHLYFKEVLKKMEVWGVEITSTADVPAGTGLGSSSSFTVGLLHALYSYKGKFVSKERLAREACEMEISRLNQPIGKQDQYAAAFGGLNYYRFEPDGTVFVEPVMLQSSAYERLNDNLLLFYTGNVRSASTILKEQNENFSNGKQEQNQIKLCQLTEELRTHLQENQVDFVGEALEEGWKLKKTLASGISNADIDTYYEIAKKQGAIGGKLLGAGGSGFLLFYVRKEDQQKVRKAMPLQEMKFYLDRQGSAVIYVGDK